MTIGLTYNGDLSRVQVALSSLPDGTVQVQRVVNAAATEALWARGVVRGGVALPIVGGTGTLDDFEFASDVANHYRTVPVDPPAGLLLDGASGSYASTPDDPVLRITGNLDLRADATLDNWTNGNTQILNAKYTRAGDLRSYGLAILPDGRINFLWSTDGTIATVTQTQSTDAVIPDLATGRLAVRATLDAVFGTDKVVGFWTAPTIDGPWTLLETFTTPGNTSIFAGAAPLTVGADEGGTLNMLAGTVHSVEVRDGIDGVLVADPDFTAQGNGATGFTDSAGRTWTVNGTAVMVGTEQASIAPSLAGQVWLKSIRYPGLNRPVTTTEFSDPERANRGSTSEIAGRSVPVGTNELRASPEFALELQTGTAEEAGTLDIILAAGGTFFIHTPANCPITGGYVQVGDTNQIRRTRSARSPRRYTTVPCRIVAPPAPQVTGTLLVAETVFRLYGDANALFAAHATGRSLLATILDPEDLIVL